MRAFLDLLAVAIAKSIETDLDRLEHEGATAPTASAEITTT